ncbi:maleylpyruvate isomerase N-terminal domain-containing protein [Aldersonia sp. NBC_00410]|uniref:maleylpyruvate isomerase N-terminal domain-containing protein n=1 Tax=Aldersonia sp. NBC_00410 TaxID=2975954 RepID=UPI0022532006|nr:maleylpyruvate isomerase N-terminal domain-containing protein [Aldersonia sp. NBC_00410]MCX5045820.1 maleylpyruvate isomerase N-terminal domain-containing protein [Aldersonia sp. NBC_00410]
MMAPLETLARTLRAEGDRIAAMPADRLDAPVPTVPGWTLENVVRHTGRVHRWVVTRLDADPDGDPAPAAPSLPHGPECLAAYRESLDAVIERLSAVDPATPAQSFIGRQTVGWWIRRQAHEVTVHRFDAADAVHAAGGPAPAAADPVSAADGIDELTALMYRHRMPELPESLHGKTIHIHGTDTPDAEWLLELGPDGVRTRHGHEKATVALRGTAEELLLLLWRRRELSTVTVFGDEQVAADFLDCTRF